MKVDKKHSKRYNSHIKSYSSFESSTVEEAVKILLATKDRVKFNETVELCVNLPLDARKGDQVIKSFIKFSNDFSGEQSEQVMVFCDESDFDAVKQASGIPLDENSFAKITSGEIVVKNCMATSSFLPKLAKIARVLRGSMPNAKLGTVIDSSKIAEALKPSSTISFRTSSDSSIKLPVGNMKLGVKELAENIQEFITKLSGLKPASVKNFNIDSMYICSTMGASIKINGVRF